MSSAQFVSSSNRLKRLEKTKPQRRAGAPNCIPRMGSMRRYEAVTRVTFAQSGAPLHYAGKQAATKRRLLFVQQRLPI
jgi:hypothetical protein